MSSYTITIAPDDPRRATTTLRVEVRDAQVQITELLVRAGADGLTAGQLPAVDLDQLLRAVTPATMTPAVAANPAAANPAAVNPSTADPSSPATASAGAGATPPPASPARVHPDESPADSADLPAGTETGPGPVLSVEAAESSFSVDAFGPGPDTEARIAEPVAEPATVAGAVGKTTNAGKTTGARKTPSTHKTTNAGKRTTAGRTAATANSRIARAGATKAGATKAGATKAGATKGGSPTPALKKGAATRQSRAAAAKPMPRKSAAARQSGATARKSATARTGRGTATGSGSRTAKAATLSPGGRAARAQKKPVREATGSASTRNTRSYRRAPADLAQVFQQAGSASAVADHYGVPRYTAQSWVRTLRRNTATD